MMKYAIIENGICVNIVVASAEYAEKIGAVPLIEGYGIGDLCVDNAWQKAEIINEDLPSIEERVLALESAVLAMLEV